ncbi:alanine racemase [Rhizohabitans arisaemae]|uniref:alanine racemase n=1 Tax=Rhizohabitans arisaemae TaxID=2720610 RepID=UPI0024B1A34A|nr:alanine racemase [Rhizohabitans arisaemae]
MRIPDEPLGPWTKGFLTGEPAVGRSLFDGPFVFPLMVLHRDALQHDIAAMAAFARGHGMELAPHVKTTMAPRIVQAQLAAGAWGGTVATPSQALALRGFAVPRILLANQVVDPVALRALAAELDRDPEFEFLCFADSVEGVEILSRCAGTRPFRVLAELGHAGGRCGSRTLAELYRVAEAVRAANGVELAGVAGYEGTLSSADEVRGYVKALREAVEATGTEILTVGGSQWFDVIAEELAGCTATVVLRSGAYVTHDDGYYRERTPFNRMAGELRPALELWAHVLSVPEPGLTVVGFGKRDAPFDEGLPVPKALRRADGTSVPLREVSVVKMYDQHAVLAGDAGLRPGDLVSFGVSHPCTAFDKWRVLPVVDDHYVVTELINTYF